MVASPPSPRSELEADLQQLWACLDSLLEWLKPADQEHRRGRLSSVAPIDVPGHLAWFDSDLVLKAIDRGPDVPIREQRTISTLAELESWAPARGAGQSSSWAADVSRMHAGRDRIRQVLATGDLGARMWWPLPLSGGWRPVRFSLEASSSHTWNHVLELWTRAHGRGAPAHTIASATHRALARYTKLMVALLDGGRAARTPPLTGVMRFTGPGGGAWTFRIQNGTCRVTEELPVHFDVMITQTPETFLRTMVLGTESDLMAVLAGEIKVQGRMWSAAAFRRLFPRPARHRPLRSLALARQRASG